jgi:hypothetical protein
MIEDKLRVGFRRLDADWHYKPYKIAKSNYEL